MHNSSHTIIGQKAPLLTLPLVGREGPKVQGGVFLAPVKKTPPCCFAACLPTRGRVTSGTIGAILTMPGRKLT